MRRSRLSAIGFGDVGRGADDVLRQAQRVDRGLGLALVHQVAGHLEPLLDVVGQLLPGEVLGGMGLLDGRAGWGSAGGGWSAGGGVVAGA